MQCLPLELMPRFWDLMKRLAAGSLVALHSKGGQERDTTKGRYKAKNKKVRFQEVKNVKHENKSRRTIVQPLEVSRRRNERRGRKGKAWDCSFNSTQVGTQALACSNSPVYVRHGKGTR